MATFTKKLKKHIFLHPVDKARRHAAVKSTLLQDQKKYSDRLEGALLDVSNLKIIGDRHLVVDGYLSMEVVADCEVFSPKSGQVLEGVINKRSKSHIGCLVLDMFNASLTLPSDSDLDPHIGDTCSFEVQQVVVDGEILFLRGMITSVTPNSESNSGNRSVTAVVDDTEEDNNNVTVKVSEGDAQKTDNIDESTGNVSDPEPHNTSTSSTTSSGRKRKHGKSPSKKSKKKKL